MSCRKLLPVLCILFALAGIGGAKPNIVIIFADDLGYGDVGCYGATKVRTPHIDRLAREGRRFTDAHSASAVCTPSRYALVTGRYPVRRGNLWNPVFLKTPLVVNPDRLTIADVAKEAGYATACIGKWHLGFGTKSPTDWNGELKPGPLELGFDYYFGVPVVNSHPPFVYVENHRVVGLVAEDPMVYGKKAETRTDFDEKMGINVIGGGKAAHALYDDEQVGTVLTGKAVEWIGEQAKSEDPFLLYFSTTNIHHPFTPAPRFKGTSEAGPYGDFIHELDWMVGEVRGALEKAGVADNTLIIFTSDNGGMLNRGGQDAWKKGHRLNGKLLGFKFDAWEGGHRVPFIARWPGKIPAGTESDALVSNIDLLATVAGLTGRKLGEDEGPDSVNLLPVLTGPADTPARDHLVIAPRSKDHLSLREGDWMYISGKGGGGFTATKIGDHGLGGPAAHRLTRQVNSDIENARLRPDAPAAQLYNLRDDPWQATNVIAKHPDVAERMKKRLAGFRPPAPTGPAVVAPRHDGFKPLGNLRFRFEDGSLDGWKVVAGRFGRPVSSLPSLPKWKHRPFNREGGGHLSTIDTGGGPSDQQTGVLESPPFTIRGKEAAFLVSGGFDEQNLHVALVDVTTGEILKRAGGKREPQMVRVRWNVAEWTGRTVRLRIVDRATSNWAHLCFDDFSVDGELAR